MREVRAHSDCEFDKNSILVNSDCEFDKKSTLVVEIGIAKLSWQTCTSHSFLCHQSGETQKNIAIIFTKAKPKYFNFVTLEV